MREPLTIFDMKKAPKVMPVNSIAQMMKPAHMKAPSKSPTALSIVKKETTPVINEASIPDLKVRNGVGHFVLPLQRLHFTYCSHCGDSATTKEYITKHIVELAKANPAIEIVVEPRWNKRPTIHAHYLEGRYKAVSVDNKAVKEISEIVENLRNETGAKAKMFHQSVESDTPAIRPVWSPFHSTPAGELDPLAKYRSSLKS